MGNWRNAALEEAFSSTDKRLHGIAERLRRLMLYPTELRAHAMYQSPKCRVIGLVSTTVPSLFAWRYL
jgi:hypothetical protein